MTLAGKHAVVTGGTRGIGLGIALLLRDRGARVSLVSRNPSVSAGENLSKGEANPFFRVGADITDERQVHTAFAACRNANGTIDVLVNNAGIAESAPLRRTDLAMWNRIIGTNLTGTFLCTREVVPAMADAGWGRVVNMASTAGLGGAPYITAYCASKHGVIGLTRALSCELKSCGVTVNAVCPGYTETELMKRAIINIASRTGRSEAQARELMAQANPEGRIATIDEVARAVLALIEGSQSGIAIILPGGEVA